MKVCRVVLTQLTRELNPNTKPSTEGINSTIVTSMNKDGESSNANQPRISE